MAHVGLPERSILDPLHAIEVHDAHFSRQARKEHARDFVELIGGSVYVGQPETIRRADPSRRGCVVHLARCDGTRVSRTGKPDGSPPSVASSAFEAATRNFEGVPFVGPGRGGPTSSNPKQSSDVHVPPCLVVAAPPHTGGGGPGAASSHRRAPAAPRRAGGAGPCATGQPHPRGVSAPDGPPARRRPSPRAPAMRGPGAGSRASHGRGCPAAPPGESPRVLFEHR